MDRRYIILLSSALAAGAGIWFGAPAIQKAYRKSKAEDVLTETRTEASKLEDILKKARKKMKACGFVMTGRKETAPLHAEIDDSAAKLKRVKVRLAEAEQDFRHEQYNDARQLLHPTFGLDDGKKRDTPALLAKREQSDIWHKVIQPLEEKLRLRGAVVENEWFLKARLKKPYQPGIVEKGDELALLPDKYFSMVPQLTQDLEMKLGEMPPELNNSMGANLARRQDMLKHIEESAKEEGARKKARGLYRTAKQAYTTVMERNDAIMWYRSREHDGKLSKEEYANLKRAQQKAIAGIHKGDKALAELDRLACTLHDQYYQYVSGHEQDRKTFTEIRPSLSFDSEGNLKTKLKTEHIPGWRFYYVLTTVTPKDTSTQRVYVGELKGLGSSWSYSSDEQVGWVRSWKRLHYTGSVSGWKDRLNPQIDDAACLRKQGKQ